MSVGRIAVSLTRARAATRRGGVGAAVLGQGAGNALLNLTTLVLNFGTTLLLSRLLGADGFGAYSFAFALAMLLSVPAVLGLTPLLVREVTEYRLGGSWGALRGLVRRANAAAATSSVVLCGGAAVVFAGTGWPGGDLHVVTMLSLALVPLVAVTSVRQGVMQGFGRVVLGRAPEAVLWPGLVVLGCGALAVGLGDRFSAEWAIGAADVAALAAALIGVVFLRRVLPREARTAPPVFETRRWMGAAAPLVAFSLISRAGSQLPIVLLGALGTAHEVGVYNVAFRVANLLPFLLSAAMPALMPAIAELDVHGRHDDLQRLITRSTRLILFGSLPIAVVAIGFAGPVLHVFGSDFGGGETSLRILAVANVVSIACGSAGTALVMLGHAKAMTVTQTAATVVALGLAAALVPPFGANGAALATAAGVVLSSVAMSVVLWRRRRIYAGALPFRFAGAQP